MNYAKPSPYRWIVLVVFMFNVALSQILWLTFCAISTDAAAVFTKGNIDNIDFLSILFMFTLILLTLPSAWLIEKLGLKFGCGIGVLFLTVFGALRAFSPNYTWLIVTSCLCAIGQPFLVNAFTKVASNWFPEKEEVLASGLLSMAIFIGMIAAMFVPDIILAPYRKTGSIKEGITAILNLYAILSVIGLVLFLSLVKNKPKHAPNPIAAEKKLTMTAGLKSIFKNRDFNLVLGACFIGMGAFNAIMTKIDFIFKGRSLGIDPAVAAGIIGGVIVVGGIFGSVIMSALSDAFHRRKFFLIIATIFDIPLLLGITYAPNIWAVGICGFLFGFFLVSALPIVLTYAVEKTHPVPETISNSILMMSGQVSGIIFVLYFNVMLLALFFGIGLILNFLITEIEQKNVVHVHRS